MRWQKINTIYQIYPRSFQDSDGDGVGDLQGIISRLDYLNGGEQSLGVDAIWLSPFYASPMKDFGYDVSDYYAVDPLFGTLEDFSRLVDEAHTRAIKVMIDFVPNHTSSEHEWFKEALGAKRSPRRDYYIFRDPAPGGGPPNNWLSVFGGSAWEYHEPTGQYYLHSFLKEQPDLNWRNPSVVSEIQKILRFWLDKGVDGIRADAVRWLGKNPDFLDDPINDAFQRGDNPYHAVAHHYSRYSPELNRYLKIMTDVVREYEDRIIIFEDHIDALTPTDSQIRRMYSIDPGVGAPFNFQGLHLAFSSREFSAMIEQYQGCVPQKSQAFYCLSNHDESRLATRFGERQARMLGALQLLLPGIPVMYYGQELGMKDTELNGEYKRDPFVFANRDPQRTPMQWDASLQAGFSVSPHTWLPLSSDFAKVNVATQLQNSDSSLHLYRLLLELRRKYPTLQHGEYTTIYVDDSAFAFLRDDEDGQFLVIANFSDKSMIFNCPPKGEIVVAAQSTGRVKEVVGTTVELYPFDLVAILY